jgi:ComEC/Rec2-related protein
VQAASLLRQRLPFVGVLLAAIGGILLASALGGGGILIATLLGISIPLALFHRQGGVILAFTILCFSLLELWSWNEAPSRKLALWFETHPQAISVEGVVDTEPKLSPSGRATFFLQAERITELFSGASYPLPIPLKVRVQWSGEIPDYGDRVRFDAVPNRPSPLRNPGGFDARQWLERDGIYNEFYVDPSEPGMILSRGHGNILMAWAIKARRQMEEILSIGLEGAPMELSAIKGITLGITDHDPEGFTEGFRFTGTMHLFAVSGLHVGMLAFMIWFALKAIRLPRAWAVWVMIPMLFFYVAITGLKAGSLRSASMVSLLLCGSLLYRRSPLLNTLAAAALIQLAINPDALFSPGWQFSYSVVGAILVLAPLMEARLLVLHAPDPFIPPKLLSEWERKGFSIWKHLSGLIAVSTAAWCGSLLPTIVYFHLVSFSAIGANLLAVPLAFAVLALGALSLVSAGFSPWVAGAFNNCNWLAAKLLLLVVQSSALLPYSHWFVGSPGASYPVITLLDLRGAECAVVESDGQFSMMNTGRKREAERDILPFLQSRGVNSIEGIVISLGNAENLGGLESISHEFAVKRMILVEQNPRSVVVKRALSQEAKSLEQLRNDATWSMLPDVVVDKVDLGENIAAVRVKVGGKSVMFIPSLTPKISREISSSLQPGVLHAEVLVLPLGNADILTTLGLIKKIAPRYLISPVDPFSRNGKPSPEWSTLLRQEGVQLFRQDETGAVTIDLDPKGARVRPFMNPSQIGSF